MTDDRPRPRYGEYAPVVPATPVAPEAPVRADTTPPAAHQPVPDAAARPRRTWDVLLTTALLLVGAFDVATGFDQFASLSATLRTLYEQQGYGVFTSDELAAATGLVANGARILLLIAAIAVSLYRISRNRLAFWAPLGAGVIAALVVAVCVLVTILGDPALAEYVRQR